MHENYRRMKKEYIRGWQTWNVNSVLSHVLMPEGFALNVTVREYKDGLYLKDALIGRFDENAEQVFPGPHAYDGSYTKLDIKWRGIEFSAETTNSGNELIILITLKNRQKKTPLLCLESGFLWNRPGYAVMDDDGLTAHMPGKQLKVFTTGKRSQGDMNIPTQTQYLAVEMDTQVVFSTNRRVSVQEAENILDNKKAELQKTWEAYGNNAPLYEAMQCSLAWDTVYDANHDRVISPVSRLWSIRSGGYVLFCWDNYFAGFMAGLGSRELAYSNLIEITNEMTADGFVPNAAWGSGWTSRDRSQPPVGSSMVLETYRRYKEKWLLEALYPKLLTWNTWWIDNRMAESGALSWGSNPYEPILDSYWEKTGVNDTFGAALESGLDNSPMYDNIPFDKEKHVMKLEDVGLTGLFILDCESLATIAEILEKEEDAALLMNRLETAQKGLDGLWDEENGFFYNRRIDTGEFSRRISPTNFYALFSRRVTVGQAQRMIEEHYKNPEEFFGRYMLPSIARNDPAYPDQNYWRGRIWAPMNFLAYMAMRRHGLTWALKDLSEKSQKLMMKEWLEHGHIHENYNCETGSGCDIKNSDKFYHWGALLSVIALIEDGRLHNFDGEIL
ncbi:MAG: hypothetical protein IJC48_04960 [Clostridia bacterium]|nr:hypothetical protein [Clostridia bacterium]MBQ4156606.1 hypothetical protein [Clostridia bacterium]